MFERVDGSVDCDASPYMRNLSIRISRNRNTSSFVEARAKAEIVCLYGFALMLAEEQSRGIQWNQSGQLT
jgi:hypothetical protein